MSSPSTSRWRVLPVGLLALLALAACRGDAEPSSGPSSTTSAPSAPAAELAKADVGPAPGPLRIELVLDDGAESVAAALSVEAAERAAQGGLALAEASSWCSGEAFEPGQVFVVKIDRSAEPVAGELRWVEVESSEPVDGSGTYPAEAFVLLAGDTALHLAAAELVIDEDLRHGTFSGTSESGVRVEGSFACG
jgi:hypothetical protein